MTQTSRYENKYDRLLRHYKTNGRVALSEKEKELLERMEFADGLIRQYNSPRDVVPMLSERFEISQTTAYRLISDTKKFFGSMHKTDKEYWRSITLEWTLDNLKKARQDGDTKQVNSAIANLIKLAGLDKEDPDMPDFSKLQQHNYYLVVQGNDREDRIDLGRLNALPEDRRLELIENLGPTNYSYAEIKPFLDGEPTAGVTS